MSASKMEDRIEVSAVFDFIACALRDLQARVERLEVHAATLASGSTRDSESLIALQDLDLLRQTIGDLARLAALAGHDPQSGKRSLASVLHLAALRDSLLGKPLGQAHEAPDPPESGRVEYFGIDTSDA